jgi:hypothetical protein
LCNLNGVLPTNAPLDLKMRALDGPDLDLQAYRGYAVWINIFATTNDEQPTVAQLAADTIEDCASSESTLTNATIHCEGIADAWD